MAKSEIIVIGASAGGFEALQTLAATLPSELPAAVFITLHLFERSQSLLPGLLAKAGPLHAANAIDGEPIRSGRIYIAPPDYHLIITPGQVRLSHGPRENMQRPCINVMFRSAATAYREHVAGVVLTGLLDDGAAGLWEIQQNGGTTIVQDPAEAMFRAMPDSAIRGFRVQYVARLREIGLLLGQLSMTDHNVFKSGEPDRTVKERPGQVCPECGGAMTAVALGNLREYRCHIGHRFGLETMIAEKSKVVDRAKEVALSQSEELIDLLESAVDDPGDQASESLQRELIKRKEEQKLLLQLMDGQSSGESS